MGVKRIPVNKQIYHDLLRQLQAGELAPGELMRTEKELQQRYQVSRTPVRQALARLEAEGYINRTPGRGTEVVAIHGVPLVQLSGFAHFYNRMPDQLTSLTIALELVPAEEEAAEHLAVKPGSHILLTRRLRLVSGKPMAYMCNYFNPPPLGAELPHLDQQYDNLQQFIQQNFKRDEAKVQEDLSAIGAPDEVADALRIAPGTPLLFVTRRGWDGRQRPVEFSRYWILNEMATYRTFLTNGPAGR